jgi:N-acetylneuraminic acid mutarotase
MRIIIPLVPRVFFVSARVGLLVVLLAGLGLFTPNAAPAALAHPSMILEHLVNPDGTLNLSTGFNGTLDLTGWQVALDATRGPVFIPLNGEIRSAVRRAGLPRRSAAGDGPLAAPEAEWLPFPNDGMDNIGTDYGVYALAVVGQDLYVGGAFIETADGLVKDLNCIARFDSLTSTWSALPNKGLAGWVEALAVIGSDLYVGGMFIQTADGSLTGLGRIARFSIGENKWYALPNGGLTNEVKAFTVVGNDLYVGGQFTHTVDGTVMLLNIAKFSGGNWSALPNNGLNGGSVLALAVSGDNMYVGGSFTKTGDSAVLDLNDIARFNLSSSTWFALPHKGLNSSPQAFALIGGDLYVGGQFSGTADGQVTNLNHIARLSGGTWSALPHNGLNANVFALTAAGTDLYVGGAFTQTADSLNGLNHVAMFSTSSNTWSALSNAGLNNTVQALTVGGGYLVVGGQFSQTTDGAVTELNHIASYSGVSLGFNVFLPLILR